MVTDTFYVVKLQSFCWWKILLLSLLFVEELFSEHYLSPLLVNDIKIYNYLVSN